MKTSNQTSHLELFCLCIIFIPAFNFGVCLGREPWEVYSGGLETVPSNIVCHDSEEGGRGGEGRERIGEKGGGGR